MMCMYLNILEYSCEEDDYKQWSMPEDTDFQGMLTRNG